MTDLKLEFAGVEFSNPFGVAAIGGPSCKPEFITPESQADIYLKNISASASYIYISGGAFIDEGLLKEIEKTYEIKTEKKASSRRFLRAGSPDDDSAGLYYVAGPFQMFSPRIFTERFEGKEEQIRIIKEKHPEVKIIFNTHGVGDIVETYVSSARRCEEAGADIIELNFSCSHPAARGGAVDGFLKKEFPPYFMGCMVGDFSELVEEFTRKVVKSVKIPVGVKLSPEIGFPRIFDFARRVRDARARFIHVVNLGITVAPPNIRDRGKPSWPFMDRNPISGSSGNWLRLVSYKDVTAITKYAEGIDIAAAGGLMKPEHSIEIMMLGAKLPQLCKTYLYNGRKIITQNINFLRKFMKDNRYDSVDEIVGIGQKYIMNTEDIDFCHDRVVTENDTSRCNGCGICVESICLSSAIENGTSVVKTGSLQWLRPLCCSM